MTVIAAFAVWVVRLGRRPIDSRLKKRQGGPFLVVALTAALVALWVRVGAPGVTSTSFWGEVAGVVAVYLFACSLLLATRARALEPWFGGLDRMYLWHKRLAVAATLLLPPHVILAAGAGQATTSAASSYQAGLVLGVLSLLGLIALVAVSLPHVGRILHLPYHRWLLIHRLIGLFVLEALLHGLLVDTVLAESGLLRAVYIVIGAAGMASYGYAELVMRRRSKSDYTVEHVDRLSADILELHLAPVSGRVYPQPGQFVFLRIGGDDAWREHPFTVAGVTAEGGLRLTIHSAGTDTSRMHARLQPGLPATVSGPYGMFDYTLGRAHQVWIAGGVGIAPFLSWLTVMEAGDAYTVDLFYSATTQAEAVYLEELRSAERRLAPLLKVHPVFSGVAGHLTGAGIAAATNVAAGANVFLCGPGPMVDDLTRDLLRLGVPRDHLHAEHFSFR